MNPIRAAYDKLPASVRSKFRSLLPRSFLRWYAHKKTDVYLVSYPKCGRTWLRMMIGRAISRQFALLESEETLLLTGGKPQTPGIPRITIVHDDRPMLKAPDELETCKQRYQNKKVIFLVRDPRDVIVSSYFEMKKRGRMFGENPYESRQATFEGSLSEFIDRRVGGFETILRYYNIWAENRQLPRGFLLVRYEDLRADPHIELRRILEFIGLQDVRDETLAEAVEFASFDNMRKMEAEGKFRTGILKPADKEDQESYKTRKGAVGGYVDYLSAQEIASLNQKLSKELADFFGYKP